MLALQRSAGNAAASQAVEGRRPGHGPGVTVQRAPTRPIGALPNFPRDYGTSNLAPPRPQDQQNLENTFPSSGGVYKQFPDPTTLGFSLVGGVSKALKKVSPHGSGGPAGSGSTAADWVKGINSQRDEPGDAYRRNCIDAARSFIASWSGNPTAAAPIAAGGVEADGPNRTKAWLGTEWKTDDHVAGSHEQVDGVWGAVATRLKGAGHGASSIVVFRRVESGNVHAVCGVNHKDKVVWIDPQIGRVSSEPMYNGQLFMTITLTPQGAPVDAPQHTLTGAP
ncbi:toxin glutamine deamidase domain-containing protein [Actinomadura spongiicola]|nr:toxin glutamine deamidase domain-containing protein [Actinomadura spongiicola]